MSNEDLKNQVRNFLREKQYDKIEGLFLDEMLNDKYNLERLYIITDEVRKRANGASRSSELLIHLMEEYQNEEQWDKLLDVAYKINSYYNKFQGHRQFIINAYKNLNSDIADFDNYLKVSGLDDENQLIEKCQKKIENFLKYKPGSMYYFERFGLGVVKEINFALEKLVVDFERRKDYSIEIRIADNMLKPIAEDHFLIYKVKRKEELLEMIKANPVDVLRMILKNERNALQAKDIKKFFEGLLSKEDLNQFWKKASKAGENDPHIKISITKPKTYEYVDKPESIDQELIEMFNKENWTGKIDIFKRGIVNNEETKKYFLDELKAKSIELLEKKRPEALEIFFNIDSKIKEQSYQAIPKYFFSKTNEEITKTIKSFKRSDSTTKALDYIKKNIDEKNPLFYDLFFLFEDQRFYETIFNDFVKSGNSEIMDRIFQQALEHYGKHPSQFIWLAKKTLTIKELEKHIGFEVLYRLLELIVYFNDSAIWKKGVNLISHENFILVEKCVIEAEEKEVEKILEFMKTIIKLDDYQKKEILNIIQARYPKLFKKEEDATFFALAPSIDRMKEKLERLLKIEIPKNSKEIGKAADHGDLRENFEYKSAKDKQQLLLTQAGEIDIDLKRARPLKLDLINTDMVSVGTKVKFHKIDSEEFREYVFLGPWEADSDKNIISYLTKFAQQIIGKHPMETVKIEDELYKIESIERIHEDDYSFSS